MQILCTSLNVIISKDEMKDVCEKTLRDINFTGSINFIDWFIVLVLDIAL